MMKVNWAVLVASIERASRTFAVSPAAAFAKGAMCLDPDGSAGTGIWLEQGLEPPGSPQVQKIPDADLTARVGSGKATLTARKGKLGDDKISVRCAMSGPLSKWRRNGSDSHRGGWLRGGEIP
jgi:hypothetical protein